MTQRMNQSQIMRRGVSPFLEEWAEHGITAEWQQFRNFATQQILWEYALSTEEILDATQIDGRSDKGIDAWYYDSDDTSPRLILIQSKDTQIQREDFSKLIEGFKDLVIPGRPPGANRSLREKAALFSQEIPEFFRIDVYLASSAIAQTNLTPNEDGDPLFAENQISIGDSKADITYYVRDIKYLANNLQILHDRPIDYTFQIDKGSFFEFQVGGHTKTVCAALSGIELAQLFAQHRQNLFRKNPRYYLLSSAKNTDIKHTLRDDSNAEFFEFNNGLTCIAESIAIVNDQHGIYVRDFQVVNGCQTVASIWSTFTDRDVDLSQVRVLAKIIENSKTGVGADHKSELIAVRSNTQNPLRAEDWKANDRRQQEWHEKFKRLPEPWFYEIKRGVWATEYASAQNKAPFRIGQTARYRKVTMKDLGQVCYAFIGRPAEAADNARQIFNNRAYYDQVFQEGLTPYQLLLPYTIYLEADKLTKESSEFVLPDADGFAVKTVHLRFPTVNAIGRILSSLAGVKQGYLSDDFSMILIQKPAWLSELIKPAFENLAIKLATESRNRGIGARSIVRRNEWMDESISTTLSPIRARLDVERKYAQNVEGTLSSMLPF